MLTLNPRSDRKAVPEGVLSILPGKGAETGKHIVSHPLVRKVDITAGTSTGRAIGSIVGANLASYTAELGGKVRAHRSARRRSSADHSAGADHCIQRRGRGQRCQRRGVRGVCRVWPDLRLGHAADHPRRRLRRVHGSLP
jgi:hypothetical protein